MSYVSAYYGLKPVIDEPYGGDDDDTAPWVRPADWTALPVLAPTDQKFVGLYGVDPDAGNYVSVLAKCSSGTYTVDWGDGSPVDAGCTSDVKKDHWYDYANAALGAARADGCKNALVTITADSGNLTKIDLQKKHSQAGLPTTAFDVNWNDISVNGPYITALAVGGTTVTLSQLEKFVLGTVAVTSFASLFYGCKRLESLSTLASTAAVTTMYQMFYGCASLRSVPAFPGTVAAVTTMANMFYGCASLRSIPAFPGTVAAVTTMANMFNGCASLRSIPAFPGTVAAVTTMANMFYGCASLRSIPAFPGTVAAVTTMANMFNGCASLRSVPAFPGTVAAVTTMSSMFNGCASLRSIPAFPGTVAAVTTMERMFNGCASLRSIPAFPGTVAAVTTMTYMFSGCASLRSIPAFPGTVAAVTTMERMFNGCASLRSIPAFPGTVAAVTTMYQMFNGCASLRSIPAMETDGIVVATPPVEMFKDCQSLAVGRTNGIRYSISYAGCKLSATELNSIFTGLGTADNSGGQQTVTITGNYGAATCDQTIATATKGWTVTN